MKYLLYALCATAMLTTSCKQQQDGEWNQSHELQFRTYIEEGDQIRPMSASESRALAGDLATGFHLSTLLTTGNYQMAVRDKLMWNVEMNRDGSYKSPAEKKYFWVDGDATLRHSFIAYSANPSGTASSEGVDPSTLAVDGNGKVTVNYFTPNEPSRQIDLLYSDNVRNVTVGTSVPIVDLVFKHRLERVMFKLIGTGGARLTNCQAKVTYKANTVRRLGTISLSDNSIALQNTYHANSTYNLGSSFSLPGSATTPATAVEVGDLIIIPQNRAKGWATLAFSYTPDGGLPQTASIELPALTAAAGKQQEVLINLTEYSAELSVAGVTLTDWNATSGDIDLEGPPFTGIDYTDTPANSYATYPSGGKMQNVRFNALKKPVAKYQRSSSSIVNATGSNPSTAAADAALANDITYQDGDKIEVTWQTAVDHANSGDMVIKSIALGADGTATVKVNGAGNAVLSYKRSNGTILWNYHIWATDSNPFATHYITGGNANGTAEGGAAAKFMDRNLGALAATTAKPAAANAYKYFGVTYQHGRPTPFSGQGTGTTVNTYTKIFNGSGAEITGSIGGYTPSNTAVSSVTSAVQNPNTYYYSSSPGNWTWYGYDISLWSDYGTNKSIYDPCPYGYRVPRDGSWNSWGSTHSQTWTNGDINGGLVMSSIWWPAAGFRNARSGELLNVGVNAYCWSSTHSSAFRSYNLTFDYNGGVSSSTNGNGSYGFSVRCVQEGY